MFLPAARGGQACKKKSDISNKMLPLLGTSQRCCLDSVHPFAAPFRPLSRRPIYSSVVLREVYWGNRHHYSLALDRLKVTASKFGKFPLAAWLTGLAIRGQWERHSFRISTSILLNSSASHIMSFPAFCGSTSLVEHIFRPIRGLCVTLFLRGDLGYWMLFFFHTTHQLKIWGDAMKYNTIHRIHHTIYWNKDNLKYRLVFTMQLAYIAL